MEIELLVRAVIKDGSRFLIAHAKGAQNTYVPGGHIEFGERMESALARELKEELGVDVEVGEYLGAVEHSWDDASGRNHEVNHLFLVTSPELSASSQPVSLEDHIEFYWLSPPEFRQHNLQPAPLRQLLANLDQGSQLTWWASTIDPTAV